MDAQVNRDRRPPRVFQVGDLCFVIKYAQATGKLDHGMRGPYRVVRVLPQDRYELRLLSGSYGKTTYAASQHMVFWGGEWTPESCTAFFDDDNSEDDGVPVTEHPSEQDPTGADEPLPGPSRGPNSPRAGTSRGLDMPVLDIDE
ncbi:hypothetical protein NE865_06141 [Phthorimaea operculella]|nr:hypothetical protein NE865_06141 [Phthorimaea operculella]